MRLIVLSALLVAVTACTTALDNGATVVDDSATAEGAVTYQAPLSVDATHVFYDTPVALYVSSLEPSQYVYFDMLPRGVVDVTVDHDDGRRRTGMRVYRVNPTGTLRALGELTHRGSVGARIESRAGGTFVIEAFGTYPAAGTTLTVTVSCARRDGQCAPMGQPGALCGTRGANQCDDGLFCDFNAGCGRFDGGGVCAQPPEVCSRQACVEVCGCDGQTYCSECFANTAFVAVDHEGSCEPPVCEPEVYDVTPEELPRNTLMSTEWTWQGTSNGFDIDARLGLSDGDFAYEQVHNPTCLHADPPCRVASRLFRITGGWRQDGTNVQLMPDADSLPAPEGLAQAFSAVENCEGDLRLRTTELGEERTFIKDRCYDFSCEEDTHCELVQVQCIRAPCPPLPTCVAD